MTMLSHIFAFDTYFMEMSRIRTPCAVSSEQIRVQEGTLRSRASHCKALAHPLHASHPCRDFATNQGCNMLDCRLQHAGFPDPVLASAVGANSSSAQVSLSFAWSSQTAPLTSLGASDLSQVSHTSSPLIYDISIQTGKRKNEIAGQVNAQATPHADLES